MIADMKPDKNDVTSVDESRRLIAQGKDIFTAPYYWERTRFPGDQGWALHPVPMDDRQTELDIYDRFFQINKRDVSIGLIVPAWDKNQIG